MRNLLLEEDKKKLRKEYLLRVSVVTLTFLFFSFVAGTIFLFPSYIISRAKEDVIRNQIEIIEQSISVREQEAKVAVLIEAKEKLNLLVTQDDQLSVAAVFEIIVRARPEGIQLSGLFWGERKKARSELVIEGVAARRETLLSFKNALKEEELFETVDLPISNLTSDKDIDFSIRISGGF